MIYYPTHDLAGYFGGNMLRILIVILSQIFIIYSCQDTQPIQSSDNKYIIAYFFPQDRIVNENEIAVEKLTHINYAFADIREGEIAEGFKYDSENFEILNQAKNRNPNLKILISVGGWTWSGQFSDMALTKVSRKKFIDSAIRFITRHNLDGIDLDWEYPNLIGNGNIYRQGDTKNFTLLLKELRNALEELGKKGDKHYLLTIAAGAFDDYIANTEMERVQEYLDFVNIMTYDQYVASADTISGHHAPLFTNPRDPKQNSADASIRKFIQVGVPAEKIVMGVPFYGRSWEVVSSEDHGLYQQGGPVKKRIRSSFNYLKPHLENQNGFTRYWDTTASAPFLFNEEEKIFITYDDEESLKEKCKYIKEHMLRGAMFWEYQSDYQLRLVQALYDGLK
jgi:chitinase